MVHDDIVFIKVTETRQRINMRFKSGGEHDMHGDIVRGKDFALFKNRFKFVWEHDVSGDIVKDDFVIPTWISINSKSK